MTSSKEPILKAPWPPLALLLLMLGGFLFQRTTAEATWLNLAFAPAMLGGERSWTMITTQFLHGGWAHFLMNSAGALAFGTPVARLFGIDLRGGVVFFVFFLVCGLFGVAGFAALHLDSWGPTLGASAGVSGLLGAVSRLMERRGRLSPIWTRTPLTFAAAWTGLNLVTAFLPSLMGSNAKVAWEAHVVGFFAGMLLIGLFVRVARPVYPATH